MKWLSSRPFLFASAFGSAIGGACLLKLAIGGHTYEGEQNAENKTFIVTGANCGIGKETVRQLAQRGAKVVMACRDMGKCESAREEIVLETKNKYIYCRYLDLASQKSVRDFAERFQKEFERLDVLINNAGVSRCPHMKTKEGIELQLGVNHMGHFLLTNLLLNRLKSSAPSRVVTVSSVAHKHGTINKTDLNSDEAYDEVKAYSQSKLANILFTLELAERLKGTGVTAYCVYPGIVDTQILRHLSFYNSTFSNLVLKPLMWPFIRTPQQGSRSTLFAALDKSLEGLSGCYIVDYSIEEPADQGRDKKTAAWLWAVSEKWTHFSEPLSKC